MSVEAGTYIDTAASELRNEQPVLSVRERNQIMAKEAMAKRRASGEMGGLACGSCLLAPVCIAGGEPNCDSSGGQAKDAIEIMPSVGNRFLFEEPSDNDKEEPEKTEISGSKTVSKVPVTGSKPETYSVRQKQKKIEEVVKVKSVSQPTSIAAVVVESKEPAKLERDKEPSVVTDDIIEISKIPAPAEAVLSVTPVIDIQAQSRGNEKPILAEALPGLVNTPSASMTGYVKANQPKTPELGVDFAKLLVKKAQVEPAAKVVQKPATVPTKPVAHESTARIVKPETAKSEAPKAVEHNVESKISKPAPIPTKPDVLRDKADDTVVVASADRVRSPEAALVVRKPVTKHYESVKTELQPKMVFEAEPAVPAGHTEAIEQPSAIRPIVIAEKDLLDIKPDEPPAKSEATDIKSRYVQVADPEVEEDTTLTASSAELGIEFHPDNLLVVKKDSELHSDISAVGHNLETEVYVHIPRGVEGTLKDPVIEEAVILSEPIAIDTTADNEKGCLVSKIVPQEDARTEELPIDFVINDEPVEPELKAADSILKVELMEDVEDSEEPTINEDDVSLLYTHVRTSRAVSPKPKAPLRIAGVLGTIASFYCLKRVLDS